MEDLVFQQGHLSENEFHIERKVEELAKKEVEPIFNVITKYDTDAGYDVSVTSFKKLDNAKIYLKDSFEEISKNWLEDSGLTLNELEDEEYSVEDTHCYLSIGDSYLNIYITLNQLY